MAKVLKSCFIIFFSFHLQAVCEHLTNSSLEDHPLLEEVFQGLSIYTNFTGQAKCVDFNKTADESLGELGWDFQVRFPICLMRMKFK